MPGGKIWLPNLSCIEESIKENKILLEQSFQIAVVSDVNKNPLYQATEYVTEELLLCPDNLTNETQMKPLLAYSSSPFYMLTLKETRKISAPSTPKKSPRRLERRTDIDSAGAVVLDSIRDSSIFSTPTKKKRS